MKDRIILAGGQRQFEYLAYEKWEDRATPAAFRFQMGNAGERHIVGKLISIIPIERPVHGSRTKSLCVVFMPVTVNFARPAEKLLAFPVEIPVVIQVVDIELESPLADSLNIFVGHFITIFRNNLERRFDPVGIIEIH